MDGIYQEVLIWARETAGLSLQEAASKLNLKDSSASSAGEKLLAYEVGKQPSRPLLLRMEMAYRQPLITFYLPRPPTKSYRGEDYRSHPERIPPAENSLVNTLVKNISSKQSILKSLLLEEDEVEPITMIGAISPDSDIKLAAKTISKGINFDIKEFRSKRRSEEAFSLLRSKIEELGVFVLIAGNLGSHHTNIDARIFRGFALADDIAPFIVINDQDAKVAWSFTLLHELVHLWIGETGISGASSSKSIEKFCNDVSSEILLPQQDLDEFIADYSDIKSFIAKISEFSKEKHVSRSLVSYRLYRNKMIDYNEWNKLTDHFHDDWVHAKSALKKKNQSQNGGPNYFILKKYRLGKSLVSLVQRMSNTGTISPTKAAKILGVRALKVNKLFS
ncbi:MAG: ImmA/IrrE family metallo-endopeptidase [Porticoccus sp.]|nr:ImmA/IrrE family metallo-endopeptidase [Porticoccus sp.]